MLLRRCSRTTIVIVIQIMMILKAREGLAELLTELDFYSLLVSICMGTLIVT
jgi:hypothetical protein